MMFKSVLGNMYLMDPNGIWEASKKTLIFIIGLHEEVKIFPRLKKKRKTQEVINVKRKQEDTRRCKKE